MKMSLFSLASAVLLLMVCSASRLPDIQVYQFAYENVLGTSFQLKVSAGSGQAADDAETIALKEIDRLNGILSTYDPSSEISRWLQTQDTGIRVSPELYEALSLFDNWKEKTAGALNASAAIASGIWKKAEERQQLPESGVLAAAAQTMQQAQWRLNPNAHTATHLSDQPLALNSFVKSYIIRKVSEKVMSVPGVSGAVVNIGGDIVIAGAQMEQVRVADPKADAENDRPLSVLNLQGRAIATSGNYRRGFRIGGQWFSHIVDARTAIPVSQIISATVVAEHATDAGALATAFNILSPEESAALAGTIPGAEFLIVTRDGKEMTSKGWQALETAPENTRRAKAIRSGAQQKFELTVELELARFEGRFRRPFVAVWVENKKKESVRTLAVWYNKTRWLPDLKRWHTKSLPIRGDVDVMSSISSATRSPGKYTLSWDGLDDKGKAVRPGTYTVYIEAAREHGTYQLIKQDIEWNGKSRHFDLEGGIEISSASLDIHQATAN